MFTGLRRVWNGLNWVYPLGNPKGNANMNPDYGNTPPSTGNGGEGSPESAESQPDMVLDYINKMLMEEEEFNNTSMYNNHPDDALQAAEKSFSDVIAEANSSSPIQPPVYGESSGDAYFSNSSNYTNDEIEFVDALLFADGDQAKDSVSYSSQLIPGPLSNQLTTAPLSDGYSSQSIPSPLSNQLTTAPLSDGYSSQSIPGLLSNQLTTAPLSDGYSSQLILGPLSNGQSSQPILGPLSNGQSSQPIPDPLSNSYSSQLIPDPFSNSYSSQPIPSPLSNQLIPGPLSNQPIPGRLSNGHSSQPVPGPLNNGSSDLQFVGDLFYDSLPVWQFNKGAEEASKFLPDTRNLFKINNGNGFTSNTRSEENLDFSSAHTQLMGPKHISLQLVDPTSSDDEIQRRRYKQSGAFCPAVAHLENFDSVLLCDGMDDSQSTLKLKESMQNELKSMNLDKCSNGRKSKRQPKKKVFDLRNVLIQCAQSLAADDSSTANQLMKIIKQHSSPVGDGSQRLAHYFADALEARLSGKGNQTYHSLQVMRVTAAEILMAYRMYMATCPFEKVSHFFTNETILKVVGNANNIHIVEFGIGFGFQWPSFMEQLSKRDGKPPKLRITAIDAPQAGHRPAERVEQTGRQLADYAHTFGIPFKYNSFSCDWETIRAEDLAIKTDELVVVSCLHGLETIADECVIIDSPRDAVLNNIREMNPAVFVHRITNGSYSAPVFVNRFREAFFHFSAVFDMIDATMPRGSPERACIEMEVHGREIMNVIACEDKERVQRPEAYKQWKMRIGRAGFSQLPLDAGIMRNAKDKFRSAYNKEFLIDNDSNWLLQGWKGRILYAISTWKLLK